MGVEIRSVQVRKMHGVSGIYRLRKNSDPPAPQNDVTISIKSSTVDYETAIEATGYWKFHYFLLIVCGLASATTGMEIMYVAFILPASECDFQSATSDKGVLSSVALIGIMFGCYI